VREKVPALYLILYFALNARINRPAGILPGGGWTIYFIAGVSITLNIQDIQLAALQSKMMLAIKYHVSTTAFNVKGNLKWCLRYCSAQFTISYDQLSSLDAVQNYKIGNGYLFYRSSGILYFHTSPHRRQCVKGGRALLPSSYIYALQLMKYAQFAWSRL
jgi:hypothetical protein